MTSFRPKSWTAVSAAVLASSLTLAACAGGEAGAGAEAGAAGSAQPAGEGGGEGGAGGGGTAPAGEGGEGGAEGAGAEAGAQAAFQSVPAESRDALRLAQLRGFFLAARDVPDRAEAQALVGQGLLEVYDPGKAEYTRLGLNEAVLRRAAETGTPTDINAAVSQINAARARAGGDPAAVVRSLSDIAAGLYRETVVDGVVDPTEYAHSRGAALSAQAELRNASTLAAAQADMDRFVELWPGATAPAEAARAATVQQVQAQASRLQLALSGA